MRVVYSRRRDSSEWWILLLLRFLFFPSPPDIHYTQFNNAHGGERRPQVDKEGSQFQWKSSETFKNFLKFKQNPIKLYSILIIFTFFLASSSVPHSALLSLIFLINSRGVLQVHYVLMQLFGLQSSTTRQRERPARRFLLSIEICLHQRLYLTRRIEPNVINIHIIVTILFTRLAAASAREREEIEFYSHNFPQHIIKHGRTTSIRQHRYEASESSRARADDNAKKKMGGVRNVLLIRVQKSARTMEMSERVQSDPKEEEELAMRAEINVEMRLLIQTTSEYVVNIKVTTINLHEKSIRKWKKELLWKCSDLCLELPA